MNVRQALAVFGIITMLLTASCGEPSVSRKAPRRQAAPSQDKDYLSLVISLDTLPSNDVWEAIYREDSLLSHRPDSASLPYFHYFRARMLYKNGYIDSAMAQFNKMKGTQAGDETEVLKAYSLQDYGLRSGVTAHSALMERILEEMKSAERHHSKLTFKYYDLMAKAYFQNDNPTESLEYAERHFRDHPYRTHPVVMQRHYDISFLLASMMNDFDKMMLYNTQQRKLANLIGDSLAIARSYDSEAQIFVRRGNSPKQ